MYSLKDWIKFNTRLDPLDFRSRQSIVRLFILLFYVLNGLLLIIWMGKQTQTFWGELYLVNTTAFVQPVNSQDVQITLYGPQIVAPETTSKAILQIRNNGDTSMTNVRVVLSSPDAALRLKAGDVANTININQLRPGDVPEFTVQITTTSNLPLTGVVTIDVDVSYEVGGIERAGQDVSDDIVLATITPDYSDKGFSSIATSTETQDVKLTLSYEPMPVGDQDQQNNGKLVLFVQNRQPEIRDLNLLIYTEPASNSPGVFIPTAHSFSFDALDQYEVISSTLPLPLASDSNRGAIVLKAQLDYTVARQPESLVSEHIPDGFSFQVSQFSQFYRIMASLKGSILPLSELAKTIEQLRNVVLGLLSVICGGSFLIYARGLSKPLLLWIKGTPFAQEKSVPQKKNVDTPME